MVICFFTYALWAKRRTSMWKMTKDEMQTEDGVRYTTYGIIGGDCTIPDISTDKDVVIGFVDRLNKFEASPINAADIVEDFLAEI